jgi:hypothetical protein
MAVIPYMLVTIYRDNDQQGWALQWLPLTFSGGDSGQPIDPTLMAYIDRSVQAEGTPGAGANLVWEGSNDAAYLGLGAANYHTLNDPFGNAVQFTSTGLRAVTEAVYTARPRVVGGDGTTSWTVTVLLRRGLR